MSKLILLLLFATAIVVSCYLIPRFLLDNQVTFTPEQKYGLIAYELQDFYMYLIGAYINGQMYGSSTLSEDDTNIEISLNLDVDCYPNTFNPTTTISYTLPKEMQVKLVVYNLKGQKVKTLQNSKQCTGMHSVVWNGSDDRNRPVSSGMYLYKLITPDIVLTNKMILMK